MKLCVVGYGAIAEKHLEALSLIEEVQPYVLVGRREEPTADFARRWRFDWHTLDLDDALSDPAVEAVVIASPNAVHAEQAEKSLRAGKHVLVEIPIAQNLEDAQRVTNLARQMDRRLMVAHTMRYFPGIREVRRRVTSGELRIHHIVGFFGLLRRTNVTSAGRPRSWTDSLLWHFGAHMVDAALWTTGHSEASDVICRFGPKHPTQGVLDLSLMMVLPRSELFTLALSYNVSQFRWRLTFIGEEATFDFDMGALYDSEGNCVVPHQSITDLCEQDREFVDSILHQRDPAITGEGVLPAMQILHKAQLCAGESSQPE